MIDKFKIQTEMVRSRKVAAFALAGFIGQTAALAWGVVALFASIEILAWISIALFFVSHTVVLGTAGAVILDCMMGGKE